MRLLGQIFFWIGIALACVRKEFEAEGKVRRRRGCSVACSAVLDYLSTLSPCTNVLIIFCLTFPPIFYDRIFLPCSECYDFEAAVAHEVGHVLGFSHPDQRPNENLVAGIECTVGNATCRDPFACAAVRAYEESDESIMHSLTRHSPRTCLSEADMSGLHFLYPLCDDLLPQSVACTKTRQLTGYLRLAMVTGVPFLLAVLLILLPLNCLRWRDQRRLRQLDSALGDAQMEINEYQRTVHLLRANVRDAVRPMTAALGRQATFSSRQGQRRVHPAPPPTTTTVASSPPRRGAAGRASAESVPVASGGGTGARGRRERRKKEADALVVEEIDETQPPDPSALPPNAARVPPAKLRAADAKRGEATKKGPGCAHNGYSGPAWPG